MPFDSGGYLVVGGHGTRRAHADRYGCVFEFLTKPERKVMDKGLGGWIDGLEACRSVCGHATDVKYISFRLTEQVGQQGMGEQGRSFCVQVEDVFEVLRRDFDKSAGAANTSVVDKHENLISRVDLFGQVSDVMRVGKVSHETYRWDAILRNDFLTNLVHLFGTAYQNRRASSPGQLDGNGLAQASAGTCDEGVAVGVLLHHGWMFFL